MQARFEAFFPVDRRRHFPPAEHPSEPRSIEAGEALYAAGTAGPAWRVSQGVVRLDHPGKSGPNRFASLAIAGDIVGCETLLFGSYTFAASALTACRLTPWPDGGKAPATEGLLASLAQAQRRAADLLALRGGQASDRVLGLIRLLAGRSGQVILPTRQDIADITDLRFETISRVISTLQRERLLTPLRLAGVHATRSYRLAPAAGH